MTDIATQKPVHVRTYPMVLPGVPVMPSIRVSMAQLPAVGQVLDANQVGYWVDDLAISWNGAPEMTVINLDRNTDAKAVQQLLDSQA